MEKLDTDPQTRIINSWEIILVAIGFIVAWIILTNFVRGGPNSSDITWYYHVGANNLKDPFILNRYFHVFIQKFFVGLLSDPLRGFQFFWSFLITTTCVLLYFSARLLTPNSSPWNGGLAVLLFLSLPVLGAEAGIPYVDVTAMALLTALCFVYLLSVNYEHKSHALLIFFGCLLFLGLRTKETVMTGAVVLFGLSWFENRIRLDIWKKRIAWVLLGVLVGVVIFLILNSLLLKDPVFGFRPADIINYFNSYVRGTAMKLDATTSADWLQGFFIPSSFLVFLLFLASGIRLKNCLAPDRFLLWTVPLVYIFLLTLSINNKWGYQARFALPILPLLCILGSQYLDTSVLKSKKEWTIFIAIVGVVSAAQLAVLQISQTSFNLVCQPILYISLFAAFFFMKRHWISSLLTISLLVTFSVFPLRGNFKEMFEYQLNYKAFSKTILPLVAFKDRIKISEEMLFFVDAKVVTDSPLQIMKNRDELFMLFNIVYNSNTNRNNFIISSNTETTFAEFTGKEFDYVLLSVDTWTNLKFQPDNFQIVNNNYDYMLSADNNFVLLESVPKSEH